MKTNKLYIGVGLLVLGSLSACSDFEDINVDPTKTTIDMTRPEYFLSRSIGMIQMDPSTGERIYYLNWGDAARAFGEAGMLSVGLYDDDYISSFYYPCIANAITYSTIAGDQAALRGESEPFYKNLQQFARIWRAMLVAQYADCFGPYPLNAATGENPVFNTEKETYQYILKELKEAVNGIDTSIAPTATEAACDPGYGYVAEKWLKLGNSLRMRYAMRLTNTDMVGEAQAEFEDACKGGNYIKTKDDMLWFESNDGWDDYTSPYSRTWNLQALSSTMANLMTNLGGVPVADQRADLARYTKPNDYLGIKYDKHFVANTDNPTKQYWLDGIPENLDPRALQMFWLVNDTASAAEANALPNEGAILTKGTAINPRGGYLLPLENGSKDTIWVTGSYTWNGLPVGVSSSWSPTVSKNQIITTGSGIRSCFPIWGAQYCAGSDKGGERGRVVFFGAWESYFLLAEGALRGWNTGGVSDQSAYESGVRASFDYFGVGQYANQYLASTDYNRVGTSVNYNHTVEPASFQANYKDGYTGAAGTVQYNYPTASKTLYGQAMNDKLTKIITQKYLAQMPYLVLEVWNDFRRLGLPFFDLTGNESVMTGSDMTALGPTDWQNGQSWDFYPQRMRYPSTLETSDAVEYEHALQLLGGRNTTMIPLWWSLGHKYVN
ncbi:MAG TPA: SusD/RagB family nutrient-binding outer membrane lipoprotein [Candidatus Phocaeicola excrementigallinarum]|nr:SusD/RagB family nutrient-binding outer membrane lipoprotein [Candidatus Phocaeicola excrementigallinarum]